MFSSLLGKDDESWGFSYQGTQTRIIAAYPTPQENPVRKKQTWIRS